MRGKPRSKVFLAGGGGGGGGGGGEGREEKKGKKKNKKKEGGGGGEGRECDQSPNKVDKGAMKNDGDFFRYRCRPFGFSPRPERN